MNKTCNKCCVEQPTTNFHKFSRHKDGLQNTCKGCRKVIDRKYYLSGNKTMKPTRERRRKIKSLLDRYKRMKGCLRCPEKEACCLDFHHVDPNTKNASVATLASVGSIGRVKEEVKKCVLVCSNCHRKIHAGILTL